MDQFFASYPTPRLWTAGLFVASALLLALLPLTRRGREGSGRTSFLVTALAFAAWAVLLLLAALGVGEAETSGWRGVLLLVVLVGVPVGLTLTLLVTADARLAAAACGLMGLGALVFPWAENPSPGNWFGTLALLAPLALLVALLLNGFWSAPLGYAAGAAALLAAGGLTAASTGELLGGLCTGLATAYRDGHIGIAAPAWLLLLLLVPLIVALSFRSLAGLGPTRRLLAIGLRCLLVIALTLALAEVHLRHSSEAVTVLFVWDRSLSIPQEFAGDQRGRKNDLREQRLLRFINDSVAKRGPRHQRDTAGLIAFGRWPRLELPPASVPEFRLKAIESDVDDTYTDIASALKLALASFPEGTGKRIVLISDGNENLGKAEDQARIAKQNGVEIDIVPVAAGRRNQDEVLVERVEAPALTEKDSRLPIRILIRSFNPDVVVGSLKLIKTSMEIRKGDGPGDPETPVFQDEPVLETVVKLRQGLNAFYFEQPATRKDAYTYEAKFVPQHVEDARGKELRRGLPGDRVENNRASVSVIARGQRAVLLVEPQAGAHKLLVDRLHKTKSSLKVLSVGPGQLPQDPTQLTQFLSRFDSILLANLAAESLTELQQKVIRSNVHDQGMGLVMVGGRDSYGAGGWQGTEVEKALPVTCDLKTTEVEGKSGLVLIMHASEIAEGNMWQKKIAQLAIEKLSPADMVGMLYFNWDGKGANAGHTWHIPFQQIGGGRARLLRLVDTMNPGDMPDADPSLKMAYAALADRKHSLGTKHIIFISDGDHWQAPLATLAKIRAAKITCTTVCVTSHGQGEVARMKKVASLTGGRAYHVTDPKQLPAIYIKETRLVSKSFVHDKTFVPDLRERAGPTEGLPDVLPELHGFVRTTPRPGPLVHVPITKKEKKETFPVLAYWHYGLGKVVAYTSDALAPSKEAWDLAWSSTPMHAKFWEQVVDWSLRAVDSGKNMTMTTEVRDGKVHVVIHTRDDKGRPLTDLEIRGGVTSPSLKVGEAHKPALKFVQKNVGVYEAEVKAEDVGSYFIHVQALRKKLVKGKDGKGERAEEVVDAVRGGVTIPYSPEFAEMESNTGLLERLRELTGGKAYADDPAALQRAVEMQKSLGTNEVFRPTSVRSRSLESIWFWLVLFAGVALFFDVAVRRISIDPHKLARGAQEAWGQLRGQAAAVRTAEFLDRLQSRKARVGETIEKGRSERRFEAGDAPVAPPPAVGEVLPPRPAPKPTQEPKAGAKEDEQADPMSRLLRAKRRAMEDRDRDKGKS